MVFFLEVCILVQEIRYAQTYICLAQNAKHYYDCVMSVTQNNSYKKLEEDLRLPVYEV